MTAGSEVVIGWRKCEQRMSGKLAVWRNTWTGYEWEADWVIGCVDSSTAAEPANGYLLSLKFC